MRNESDVKAAVKKVLNKFGPIVWWYMPVPNGYGEQGVPDFLCSVGGQFLGIETKFGRNGLTPSQVNQLHRITASKALHMVITEQTVGMLEAQIAALLELSDARTTR